MKLYNLKDPAQQVSFSEAVQIGLGHQQGLFFPTDIMPFNDIDAILAQDFVSRSQAILTQLIGDEIAAEQISTMVESAFTFAAPLVCVNERLYALELFHGPTLAFKDFGGRFMAQALAYVGKEKKITILTATSGDTGAAVAHAFLGMRNINVVILYPKGKISPLQEKLFCTLGDNIHTLAIDGDFDDCQALVKKAFDDQNLRFGLGLNSANSINISRLLAQVCYYFEAIAQLPTEQRQQAVFSVPCGNFGNLTAGLIAKALGLPVKRFIAATNANDTVVRYLRHHQWAPKPTVATLSNAMDVSCPNNWPRIEALSELKHWSLNDITGVSKTDAQTKEAMQGLYQQGYLSEPHGAIAYQGLVDSLASDEVGIFLATAHPAKFKGVVDDSLALDIELPETLAYYAQRPLLSMPLANDFEVLKAQLLNLC